MPTRFELNEMYVQRVAIGGFAYNFYWSSSEANFDVAWWQYFVVGTQGDNSKVYVKYYVRSVRAF